MLSKAGLIGLITLVWSAPALSDCTVTADGLRAQCLGPVHTLYSNDGGDEFYFKLGGEVATLPCSSPTGAPGWWGFRRTDSMYREWYSLLLTAAAANATLYVISHPENAGSACEVQRIEWRN